MALLSTPQQVVHCLNQVKDCIMSESAAIEVLKIMACADSLKLGILEEHIQRPHSFTESFPTLLLVIKEHFWPYRHHITAGTIPNELAALASVLPVHKITYLFNIAKFLVDKVRPTADYEGW